MAQSPSHKLGQWIGTQFEAAVHRHLKAIADEFGLYLDYQHPRPARKNRHRVSWKDRQGNAHILDFVMEEEGTEEAIGRPRAFIEVAWRQYTKHSRNKAQEIQCAVVPLAQRYHADRPFLGVVIGGEFTNEALEQLRSYDFHVVHCPYEQVVDAFARGGVDVAYEEDASDDEVQRKVDECSALTTAQQTQVEAQLARMLTDQFGPFSQALRECLGSRVVAIHLLLLSGTPKMFTSVAEAMAFIEAHNPTDPPAEFVRYELIVRYSNDDEVRGKFQHKQGALHFLERFVNPGPADNTGETP